LRPARESNINQKNYWYYGQANQAPRAVLSGF